MFLFFLKAIGLTFVFNFVLNLIASIILVRLDYNTKFKAKVNSVVSQILFSTLNLILYLFILKMAKSDFNVEMLSRNNLLAIIGDLIFCQVLLNYSAKGIMNEMKKNYRQNIIAFQHETFTKSPLQNVLELVQQLPDKANLHLISHSRGGLVGEVLARFCSDENGFNETSIENIPEEVIMTIHLYLKTGLADIVCIKDINNIVDYLPFSMKQKLLVTLKEVIKYPPFEVITIHDSFAVLPNNCNRLRYWYKEILAELAESNILEHLLSQIMVEDIKYNKLDNNLAPLIRNSNYGLC